MGDFSGILTAFVASIPQKHIARVGRLLGMFVYIVTLFLSWYSLGGLRCKQVFGG